VVTPGETLRVELGYDLDLFDPPTAARLAGHLETLLAGIAAAADRTLGELPMLTAVEQRQLAEWNATDGAEAAGARPSGAPGSGAPGSGAPGSGALGDLFTEQVRRTPDAVAVAAEDVSLSYAELGARANRLAHRLLRLGVTAECPVGVLVERSVEIVVAELAVVLAGGAYVPVDGRAPAARMRRVLQEAGATVLLTDAGWASRAAGVVDGPVVVVDADPSLPAEPAARPDVPVHPDALAYVMYTSARPGCPRASPCGTGTWRRWRPTGGSAPGRTSGCCCTRRPPSTPRPTSCGCRCSPAGRWWWPRRGTSTATSCAGWSPGPA
jgi:non-ribosomal peptide synthetase component F